VKAIETRAEYPDEDFIFLQHDETTIVISVPQGAKLSEDMVLVWWYENEDKPVHKLGRLLGKKESYPGPGNTDLTRGREYIAWGNRGIKVPKIELDDGTIAWGPEVWWRPLMQNGLV
jgi:hypothetical protein